MDDGGLASLWGYDEVRHCSSFSSGCGGFFVSVFLISSDIGISMGLPCKVLINCKLSLRGALPLRTVFSMVWFIRKYTYQSPPPIISPSTSILTPEPWLPKSCLKRSCSLITSHVQESLHTKEISEFVCLSAVTRKMSEDNIHLVSRIPNLLPTEQRGAEA